MQNRILHIALPSIISNITVPLLGLIDLAIVGHLGVTAYIGAIAVGGLMFNIIYWLFSFLRMGTSGLTSQAYGKRDLTEVTQLLIRSVGTGVAIAIGLLIIHHPIRQLTFEYLIHATPEVERWATVYFNICIWGAPATLALYGFSGWFIGMQNSRFPMFIAITQNIVNIIASLSFVYFLDMKIEGVAFGTLIAQYAGLFMAVGLWLKHYGKLRREHLGHSIFRPEAMLRFFSVNKDIFFRTLCLIAVTLYFTSAGASQGETILAVNALLMQLFTLFSYVMDGFAYAGEALIGRHYGAQNYTALQQTVRQLFKWGITLALFFTLLYAVFGQQFLTLLTNDPTLIAAAEPYRYWVLAIPLAGFSAFLWDGIFIGITATRQLFLSMLIASLLFFALYLSLHSILGNHALWLAFIAYLLIRGLVQTLQSRKIFHERSSM